MKQVRAVLAILFAVFLVWLFYWALFSPKEDISARIYKTIKEQEKHPDLSYNKVTFEEISDNNKFWQLNAESAIVNKDTGIATLKETIGTFFRAGKEVLRFRAPAALWDMKKKEIYLDQPLGYDISSEKEALTSSKKNGNNSLFNFNPGSENRNKYWFQAKNLSWRMLDQKIFCDGGIIVKKGNITGYANSLTGDVEFNEVRLNGLPHVEINNPKNATVYISAESFELRRKDDSLFAYGNPTIRWKEAVVVSKSAKYLQNKQLQQSM